MFNFLLMRWLAEGFWPHMYCSSQCFCFIRMYCLGSRKTLFLSAAEKSVADCSQLTRDNSQCSEFFMFTRTHNEQSTCQCSANKCARSVILHIRLPLSQEFSFSYFFFFLSGGVPLVLEIPFTGTILMTTTTFQPVQQPNLLLKTTMSKVHYIL